MEQSIGSLRPDGSGGVWAQVFIDIPLGDENPGSNSVEINVLLNGAASLSVDETMTLAKAEAAYLVARIVAANK